MGDLQITMTLDEVWVRGQITYSPDGDAWTPLGIYTTQQQAAAACVFSNEFIVPVPLNAPWPDLSKDPRGSYPRRII